MNKGSIVILILVASFIAILGAVIIFKGIKIKRADKKDDSKPKEEKKAEANVEAKKVEEKPLPVGILKEEIKKPQQKDIEEFAPLREKEVSKIEPKEEKQKSVSEQIKELSPEMKAILLSDVIKPKF